MVDFDFKKSLGQNFIKDENIIDKIVKYSGVDKDTLVIEIGPGAGSLSKKIIPISGYAILYEIDTRLKEILDRELESYDNYEIIFGDFLEQKIDNVNNGKYSKVYVIANLPYYITSPIIHKLLLELYPDRMIIMVQEEVADRLSAECGNRKYGMISVLLGAKYKIKKLFRVSKGCFVPSPKVDSAVISLDKNDLFKDGSFDDFEKFIKEAFQFKRKNLKNNLKKYDILKIEEVLNKYNYSLLNRAEEIPVEVFIEVFKNMSR